MKEEKALGPLVSVVIPVFNGSNYLAQAIDSVLNQTYQNIEILVINDGSNDDGKTREVAESYGDKIFYVEKTNGGVSSALNLGIRNMRGEYFSWLSHDDLYVSHKIESQLREIQNISLKEDVVVYSDCIKFTEKGLDQEIKARKYDGKSVRYFLTRQNRIHGCSLLIPRSAFNLCGVFDERLLYVQDNEMWFRLAERYCFIYISEPLVLTRVHQDQCGTRRRTDAKSEADALKVLFVNALKASDFGKTKLPWVSLLPVYYSMRFNGYLDAAEATVEKIKTLRAWFFIPIIFAIINIINSEIAIFRKLKSMVIWIQRHRGV